MTNCLINSTYKNIKLTTIKREGFYGSEIETGLRFTDGSFELVQHGWGNYKDAHSTIVKLLAKNKTADEIKDILDFIRDKGFLQIKPLLG